MPKVLNKKGIESYIIILLIISVVMTLFLIFLLNGIYGEEHQDCKKVNFDYSNACKDGNGVKLDITNNAVRGLELEINGKLDKQYYFILSKSKKQLKVDLKNNLVLKLLPIIRVGNKIYECSGKVKEINMEILTRC